MNEQERLVFGALIVVLVTTVVTVIRWIKLKESSADYLMACWDTLITIGMWAMIYSQLVKS